MASHTYPDEFKINLPEPYLISIGRVCAHWGYLEYVVEMAIIKFAGMNETDARSKIMLVHMSWPQRMDILGSLVHHLLRNYPHLTKFKKEISPLLTTAQVGRNKIIHAFWGLENGQVHIMRASARGQLKLYEETISLEEIDRIATDIAKAGARLLKLVLNK